MTMFLLATRQIETHRSKRLRVKASAHAARANSIVPRRPTDEPRGGEASLRGESNRRVEFRGATRGQIAGEKRDDDKQKRNREIRRRIIRPHMEKQTCHDARENEGTAQTGDNTNRGQRHSLPNDQSEHTTALRAERHADANFLGALRDGVSHYAVDAERGEQERGAAEDCKELHGNTPRA